MPVVNGSSLGLYEILDPLGAGGMGEVYRARDTRLGRTVAIKVLPESFAFEADRIARFEREAKVLASLNHPHIAALFGMEEAGTPSIHFLVMELVEGETLADRLERGPVPVADALTIALRIAEGLEAAHEKGVVHRDLKPANVKIGADDRVKIYALSGVLFGVAFDASTLTLSGDRVPLVEGIRRSGAAQVTVSKTGVMAYLPGPASALSGSFGIALIDRSGDAEVLKIQPGSFRLPRVSPHGKRIAYMSDDGDQTTLWVYELSGTSAPTRLTFEGQGRNQFPVWSWDSQRITFQTDREKDRGIFWQRADEQARRSG
jgi:serine/threonine protein kinase